MLTTTQCRNAKPRDKSYKLTDSNGLYLEIRPNGSKRWRYRFELVSGDSRKESTFAIGDFADPPSAETLEESAQRRTGRRFTLAEARLERQKARDLVKQGVNPSHDRKLQRIKQEHSNANTFENLAHEWLSLKDWEQNTKNRRLDMLQRVVFKKIGKLPVKSITPMQILDVLQTALTTNGPSVASEARRTISSVFDFAIATLRAESDPVHPVRKSLPANKTQHKRPLSELEIGQLLRDVEGHGGRIETVVAFKLMWLTLCRPSEVVEARWEEFDLDGATWTIAAERMKMRKQHVVPLSTQAVEMLRVLHGVTGKREHLFPNRDHRHRPMATASFRQMLKSLGWAGKYSPHATRATGSTKLNEMGYSSDWIERQLAHSAANTVRGAY
jgi:integrase